MFICLFLNCHCVYAVRREFKYRIWTNIELIIMRYITNVNLFDSLAIFSLRETQPKIEHEQMENVSYFWNGKTTDIQFCENCLNFVAFWFQLTNIYEHDERANWWIRNIEKRWFFVWFAFIDHIFFFNFLINIFVLYLTTCHFLSKSTPYITRNNIVTEF